MTAPRPSHARLRQGTLALVLLLLLGCSAKLDSGTFHHLDLIDRELARGISTREDVRRLLGNPSGTGGASLPTDTKAKEVWYYEDVEMTGARDDRQTVLIDLRQQVLLLFFDREVFDGYLWFTNTGTGKAQ